MNTTGDKATCIASLNLMATGTVEELAAVYGPDATNREAREEPAATRAAGPEAIHATALWLREAHSDLRWEVHDAVQDGDLVVGGAGHGASTSSTARSRVSASNGLASHRVRSGSGPSGKVPLSA